MDQDNAEERRMVRLTSSRRSTGRSLGSSSSIAASSLQPADHAGLRARARRRQLARRVGARGARVDRATIRRLVRLSRNCGHFHAIMTDFIMRGYLIFHRPDLRSSRSAGLLGRCGRPVTMTRLTSSTVCRRAEKDDFSNAVSEPCST